MTRLKDRFVSELEAQATAAVNIQGIVASGLFPDASTFHALLPLLSHLRVKRSRTSQLFSRTVNLKAFRALWFGGKSLTLVDNQPLFLEVTLKTPFKAHLCFQTELLLFSCGHLT